MRIEDLPSADAEVRGVFAGLLRPHVAALGFTACLLLAQSLAMLGLPWAAGRLSAALLSAQGVAPWLWMVLGLVAVQAGLSRRYGGIHFESADLEGQRLGRAVADRVWRRGQALLGRPES